MRNWIYLLIGTLLLVSCDSSKDQVKNTDQAAILGSNEKAIKKVKITVRFAKPLLNKQVSILISDQNLSQHSTYVLENLSRFEQEVEFEKAGIYHLQIAQGVSVPFVVSLEENLIELDIDNTLTPPDYTVKNSSENTKFSTYLKRFSPMMQPKVEDKLAYLDSISPSCAAAEIYAFEINEFKGEYASSIAQIKEKFKGKSYAGNLLKMIEFYEKEPVAVGKKAPEFLLKSMDGKEYGPQSFAGKYVLLDFWASWCGPCRQEVPNVRKAYAKYKDKGFEVLGVSTDQSESAWKNAVDKLEMKWVSVRDSEGKVSSTYKIQYIPTVYLIGPDGVILADNVRGAKLEQLLEKYLGK